MHSSTPVPPEELVEHLQATVRTRRTRVWSGAPWLVAIATLVLRLATAAHGPTDWDSAQYASAVNRFDVTHGLPQPPGYWLYVEAGRMVKAWSGLGTIQALVVVTAIASAAAAGLAVVAGRELGDRWIGMAAGVIVATSPFAWFSGSIVATYSFDMAASSLLIILAWRARPGSWHGVGAVVALGLLAGFRPSIIQAFAILAIIAVLASTRRWSRLVITALAGIASVAVWLVPMLSQQPGGARTFFRATRTEFTGAAQATSIFDHAAGGHLNLGIFAAYSLMALAPLAVLAISAGTVLMIRGVIRPMPARAHSARIEVACPNIDANSTPTHPWYQSRTAILAAAMVPPMAIGALIQFAKGGYVLAYLPAAVIALLIPVGALNHRVTRGRAAYGFRPWWLVLTSLSVALIAGLHTQRFVAGYGVLPQHWLRASSDGLWLQQARYQAPYADTRASILSADAIDSALGGLRPAVNPGRDIVVFDTLDGGANLYRNAGFVLPEIPIALITSGGVLYNQLHGALYYAGGDSMATGTSGSAFLVARPSLAGLTALVEQGYALPVSTPRPIGDYRIWQLLPGTTVLGVHLITQAGARSLGRGI